MRPVALAAIRAGLIDDEMLRELNHWGFVSSKEDAEPYTSVEEALTGIEEALSSEEQVRLKRTDLDLLRLYLTPERQLKGRLVVVDPEDSSRASRSVTFCPTFGKRYVLPWMSSYSPDLLVNGESYLIYKEQDGSNTKVFFSAFEELFFGDVKAFLVLEASSSGGGSVEP